MAELEMTRSRTVTMTLLDDPQSTPTIQRDRWGRPLITPPDGGKPKPYTRASTLAKALDDNQGLIDWSTCTGIVLSLIHI